MLSKLNQRINRSDREGGFTLIELLVVIIIIGILLAIAVPSYMSFRDRANDSAAKANVRASIPAVEAYFADQNTYVGMTQPLLVDLRPGDQGHHCRQSDRDGLLRREHGWRQDVEQGRPRRGHRQRSLRS